MQLPLITDIQNDNSFKGNFFRILLFLFLVIILDYLLSFILLKGIERSYGLKSDAEILLIGHSQLMLALDKKKLENITGKKVAKYTREGVNIADRLIMLKQYFAVCKKKPKVVVLGVDPWLFTGKGLSKNSYTLFYPFMDTPVVDRYIHNSALSRFDYLRHKYIRCCRFDPLLIYTSLRDNLSHWANLKSGVIDTMKLQKELVAGTYRKITFEKENITIFKQALEFLAEQKVKVVLVNTPVYKPLLSIQSSANQQAIQIITAQVKKMDNTTFMDLSPTFTNQPDCFFDPIHMNPKGEREVTKLFIKLLIPFRLL